MQHNNIKVIQWVSRRHKVLTHRQEHLFRKVTYVSIHSFVEWLDTFSYALRPADVTVKEVNHIRSFVIDIATHCILLPCRLAIYIYIYRPFNFLASYMHFNQTKWRV